MPKLPPPPRIAYVLPAISYMHLICVAASAGSFDHCPVIVARVAGFLEQVDPALRVVMKLGGQHPAVEQVFLLRGPIAVDLDKSASFRGALDFLDGANGAAA